jgi:hypothetical protein
MHYRELKEGEECFVGDYENSISEENEICEIRTAHVYVKKGEKIYRPVKVISFEEVCNDLPCNLTPNKQCPNNKLSCNECTYNIILKLMGIEATSIRRRNE